MSTILTPKTVSYEEDPASTLATRLGATLLSSLKNESRVSFLDGISEARHQSLMNSSHQKCLNGSTKLLDSGGELHSLEDLAATADSWIETVVVTPEGNMVNTKAHSFEISNWAKSAYTIIMDNGQQVTATEDHLFLTPSGEWKTAEQLSFGHLLQSAVYNPRNKYPNLSINEVSSIRRLDYEYAEPMYSFKVDRSDRMFIADQVGENYSLLCARN